MKFQTDITQELSKAWDCEFQGEVLADVYFDHEPAEPMEQHYPGCAEAAPISSIIAHLGDNHVVEVVDHIELAGIEEQALEFYHIPNEEE